MSQAFTNIVLGGKADVAKSNSALFGDAGKLVHGKPLASSCFLTKWKCPYVSSSEVVLVRFELHDFSRAPSLLSQLQSECFVDIRPLVWYQHKALNEKPILLSE